jgi:hypothetical protein
MRKKVTYRLGPLEGVGANITNARAHAERQAAEALNRLAQGGTAFPSPPGSDFLVIEIRPNLYSWGYGWVERDHYSFREITVGFETYAKALWGAIEHTCQLALDKARKDPKVVVLADWLDEVERWAEKVLRDPSQAMVLRSQLRDRCNWLARYEGWRAQGKDDNEAHQLATEGRSPS